jgi:7-cyano-7-deazaguanine synthase
MNLVVLSGGLDSTVCMALAAREGPVVAVTFDYGQRHRIELDRAAAVAARYQAEQLVVRLDASQWGGSALTDPAIEVPESGADSQSIPVTYVPARNLIFLSVAAGVAEVRNADAIYIGVNALDYSGYPDCRPEFIRAFEQMANLATKAGVEGTQRLRIHTPLIDLTKAQTIERGLALGVDYALTHSCYDPDEAGRACGTCDSCLLRDRGFAELGLADPALADRG